MITKEQIKKANENLPTIPQKGGKQYVMVKDRVKAFREIEPGGCISTEILHLDETKVVMKTTISDENGQVLATGIASEKFDDSFITKTSAFEVCETSAVGRGLGFLSIGTDDSMASAEEVANAFNQQNQFATDREKKTFINLCKSKGLVPEDILRSIGWENGPMTKEQHGLALMKLSELMQKELENA